MDIWNRLSHSRLGPIQAWGWEQVTGHKTRRCQYLKQCFYPCSKAALVGYEEGNLRWINIKSGGTSDHNVSFKDISQLPRCTCHNARDRLYFGF